MQNRNRRLVFFLAVVAALLALAILVWRLRDGGESPPTEEQLQPIESGVPHAASSAPVAAGEPVLEPKRAEPAAAELSITIRVGRWPDRAGLDGVEIAGTGVLGFVGGSEPGSHVVRLAAGASPSVTVSCPGFEARDVSLDPSAREAHEILLVPTSGYAFQVLTPDGAIEAEAVAIVVGRRLVGPSVALRGTSVDDVEFVLSASWATEPGRRFKSGVEGFVYLPPDCLPEMGSVVASLRGGSGSARVTIPTPVTALIGPPVRLEPGTFDFIHFTVSGATSGEGLEVELGTLRSQSVGDGLAQVEWNTRVRSDVLGRIRVPLERPLVLALLGADELRFDESDAVRQVRANGRRAAVLERTGDALVALRRHQDIRGVVRVRRGPDCMLPTGGSLHLLGTDPEGRPTDRRVKLEPDGTFSFAEFDRAERHAYAEVPGVGLSTRVPISPGARPEPFEFVVEPGVDSSAMFLRVVGDSPSSESGTWNGVGLSLGDGERRTVRGRWTRECGTVLDVERLVGGGLALISLDEGGTHGAFRVVTAEAGAAVELRLEKLEVVRVVVSGLDPRRSYRVSAELVSDFGTVPWSHVDLRGHGDGRALAQLRCLPGRPHRVSVSLRTEDLVTAPLAVLSDVLPGPGRVALELAPLMTFDGRVQELPEGCEAYVACSALGRPSGQARVAADGTFRIEGMLPGRYRLCAYTFDGVVPRPLGEATVELVEGKPTGEVLVRR